MDFHDCFLYLPSHTNTMANKDAHHLYLRRQAALISLLVGMVMLIIKTTAYFLTDSAAILSDALESIVHVAATAMAYYSVMLSSRPADDSHPYGHGKVEFFSAGIEGGLIVAAAFAIIYEAIRGLVVGRELAHLETGIYLIAVASVVNLVLGWFLIRRGKATHSLTLVADGKHVLTDSWTSFGVVGGLLLVHFTGIEWLDPLVAIVVALNILVSGYQLIRISVGGLMDESDHGTLQKIASSIEKNRTPGWINVHQLRVIRSGSLLNVDFHLIIPFYWSVRQAHDFQEHVSTSIANDLPTATQLLIHFDPCQPSYCSMCTVDPCSERQAPFITGTAWRVENMVRKAPKPQGPEDQ